MPDDGPRVLGEILVCPDVAAEAAAELGHSMGREVVLYAVHGMLHLAGFDDHEPDDVCRMRAAEAEILLQLEAYVALDDIF